jgi:sialic acid synthase SpsE
MVAAIRDAELALGSGRKQVHDDEQELRTFARRSIFALSDIAAGETFTTHNIAVLRAGKRGRGLDPAEFSALLGRTSRSRRTPHSDRTMSIDRAFAPTGESRRRMVPARAAE